MPKKKQGIFPNSIPGKFIPRTTPPPPPAAFRPGTGDTRFNAKMAELLASSSSSSSTATVVDESEPVLMPTDTSHDDPTLSTTSDSSRVHSKLLHRRIVTMLETLRRRGGGTALTPTTTTTTPVQVESKYQPITFGQLRQATTPTSIPSTTVDERSNSQIFSARSFTDIMLMDAQEKQLNQTAIVTDSCPDLTSATATAAATLGKSSPKRQPSRERLYYSPSLERLLEQHNVVPRSEEQKDEEQQQRPPLTVDEILATYYSKVAIPTSAESQPQSASFANTNMSFYIHPPSRWNQAPTNQPLAAAPPPPRLMLNQQNGNRPPPPSYSSSVASGHRPPLPPTVTSATQQVIRPPVPSSVLEHLYPPAPATQHLLPTVLPVVLPSSGTTSNSSSTHAVRPPPPSYQLHTTNIERSHSALSSMNRPSSSSSSQQYTPTTTETNTSTNIPKGGFDREFSRLLYGKDDSKSRHQRQKRKAFSDPVKKSVEEAGRSIEKTHRRAPTHLNRGDTVKEEEETGSDSNELDKSNVYQSLPQRRFQRQSDLIENDRESAKKAIVPANPLLTRPIPSFLRVYSQAPSSNDILLQWQLFTLPELESFDRMMSKLFKDENLARVQLYEIYRAALVSTLASKSSSSSSLLSNTDDDSEAITTAL